MAPTDNRFRSVVGVREVPPSPGPSQRAASALGQVRSFGLEIADDGRPALAECGTFIVEIEGAGEPPARLDLHTIQ